MGALRCGVTEEYISRWFSRFSEGNRRNLLIQKVSINQVLGLFTEKS
jgi:hypothetical protein